MKILTFITGMLFTTTAFTMDPIDPIAMKEAAEIELQRIHLIESISNGDAIDFAGKYKQNLNKALYIAYMSGRTNLISDIIDAGAEVFSVDATLALIQATLNDDKNAMGLLLDAGVKHMKICPSLYFAAEHLNADIISKLVSIYSFKKEHLNKALFIVLDKRNTTLKEKCLFLLEAAGATIPCPWVEQLKNDTEKKTLLLK